MADNTPAFDTTAFDTLVAIINYPVYVITTVAGGQRSGCLVGFATQASIDPPRFLVGISQANHTHRIALDAEYLAVHLISTDHRDLADLFGGTTGDDVDKFERCGWAAGPHGLPILTACEIWFAGRILDRIPVGDHTAHLLAPVGGDIVVDEPARCPWMSFADTRDVEPGHGA